MANTTNFSVRMDSDIKKQCETLYNELGVNLTTTKKPLPPCWKRNGLREIPA